MSNVTTLLRAVADMTEAPDTVEALEDRITEFCQTAPFADRARLFLFMSQIVDRVRVSATASPAPTEAAEPAEKE